MDFRDFEETFKTKAQPKQEEVKKEAPSSKAAKALQRIGTPKAVQPPVFLETNRVRNIGIAMKRFGKDVKNIKNSINRYIVHSILSLHSNYYLFIEWTQKL